MCASASGHITMVDFLLTKGANIESQNKVRYAVSLQYPLGQNKQVIEYCTAAVTYDVTVRCSHDVLLMAINGLSNATNYTILCHYSYSACLILRFCLCSVSFI